jgi:hypothetical protein
LGSEMRSRKSIRSRSMSSIAAILLLTWERRVRFDCWSPSREAKIESSSASRVTDRGEVALGEV